MGWRSGLLEGFSIVNPGEQDSIQSGIIGGLVMATVSRTLTFSPGVASKTGTAYLIVLFVAGFLTNFIPIISFGTGTLLLYSLAFFLSLFSLLQLLNPLLKGVALAASATFVGTCLVVLKAATDANPLGQRIHELAIFLLGMWPLLFFVQIEDRKTREQFIRTLAVGLFCLCLFGIFQGVFATSLPERLFALQGDERFTAGEDRFRPTALTGNPIIFSSILIFASALFFALWLERRRSRFLWGLLGSVAANYLTYTRASLFLLVPVLVLVWLLHHRFRLKQTIIALVSVVLILAASTYIVLNATNLFIVQRLIGSGEDSLGSTLGHFITVQNAWETIVAHPWAGVGVGSQGDFVGPGNAIITDGAWWILLLEFGVPLTIFLVVLLLLMLFPVAKHVLRKGSDDRALAIATLSFHAYAFPASFINSAILGHISFALYWAVLGLSMAAANSARTPVNR